MRHTALLLTTLLPLTHSIAAAEDPCTGFKWELGAETALFQMSATRVSAGVDAASAPDIETGRLYQLDLSPQSAVRFAAEPSRPLLPDGVHAGMTRLSIPRDGLYRISVDASIWIDVVADGELLESLDFNGVAACTTPRKVVLYRLTVGDSLVIQLANAIPAAARLAVTAAE